MLYLMVKIKKLILLKWFFLLFTGTSSLRSGPGSETSSYGSESSRKFRFLTDPDPQHCKRENCFRLCTLLVLRCPYTYLSKERTVFSSMCTGTILVKNNNLWWNYIENLVRNPNYSQRIEILADRTSEFQQNLGQVSMKLVFRSKFVI
jgi:hypothetical protein